MLLHRTELAAQALRSRCPSLGVIDRQILILANGRHSVADLLDMLGLKARSHIAALQARGLLRSGALVSAAPNSPVAPAFASASTPAAAVSTGQRRSRAAAKMYMLDMLQMIRSAEAAAGRVAIQTAENDAQLVQAFCAALDYMQQHGGANYARKTAQQLQAVIPLEMCAEVDNFLLNAA